MFCYSRLIMKLPKRTRFSVGHTNVSFSSLRATGNTFQYSTECATEIDVDNHFQIIKQKKKKRTASGVDRVFDCVATFVANDLFVVLEFDVVFDAADDRRVRKSSARFFGVRQLVVKCI